MAKPQSSQVMRSLAPVPAVDSLIDDIQLTNCILFA